MDMEDDSCLNNDNWILKGLGRNENGPTKGKIESGKYLSSKYSLQCGSIFLYTNVLMFGNLNK